MEHYTTIEQSKKLLELGLSPETADLYYSMLYHIDKLYHVPNLGEPIKVLSLYNEGHTLGGKYKPKTLEEFCIPCWSLGALLELMPEIDNQLPILKKYKNYYCVVYSDNVTRLGDNQWQNGKTTTEAAYNMVVWLLENGYIQKGEQIMKANEAPEKI